MKRSVLTLFGLAAVLACSNDRNRTIPADAPELAVDLRLPDTSQPASSVEQPAAPAPLQKVKPRRAPRPKPAVAPETPVEDTVSSQAYAPDAGRDSSRADTITAIERVDTAIEHVAAAPANPDSSPEVVTRDSVAPIRPEPPGPSDADTGLTAATDTMVGRDPVATAPTPAPPPAASTAAATLSVGTEIKVSLDDSINSRHDSVGRIVSAHVMENVVAAGGQTVIPAGAPVRLTITKLEPAKSKSAAAGKLAFRVDGIAMGGELQKVKADVRPVPHELRGRGVTAGDAGKVGVGAVGGAVLGRVIGGNTRGAVIGGVVGAAGGAVVASQTAHRDVVVKAKTPVVFVLTEPLVAQ
ncbi:MAG TPA: hypothetical protein VFS51_01875 [Gemmatimonadales bacterium]|nr:hypothetical protein [Gemmatimonadales bacterium]